MNRINSRQAQKKMENLENFNSGNLTGGWEQNYFAVNGKLLKVPSGTHYVIRSYNEPIAYCSIDGKFAEITENKYSITTTRHNICSQLMDSVSKECHQIKGVSMETKEERWARQDLLVALREAKIARNKAELEMVRAKVNYDNFFLRNPNSSTNRTLAGLAEDSYSQYYSEVSEVKKLEEALNDN